MNSICLSLLLFLTFTPLLACNNATSETVIRPLPAQAVLHNTTSGSRHLNIDTSKSSIKWKGTKLNYTGKHEGTVAVRSGTLFFDNGKLTGGSVVVDMRRIQVTDIPPHETVPIRNLTNHLSSDFDTKRYPTSEFDITAISYQTDALLTVQGNMRLRGVTRNIQVQAKQIGHTNGPYQISSNFVINRLDWNIGMEGSWLENKLVDKEIELQLEIVTH